jgi:hypothetical protein
MSLDLSRLKPVELPTETLELQLKDDFKTDPENGEKTPNIQKIEVHAIPGGGMIAWSENQRNNPESVMFEERAYLTALVYGADMSEPDARLLLNYDRASAKTIGTKVWLLTAEFYSKKHAEAETAEKNSEPADVSTGN